MFVVEQQDISSVQSSVGQLLDFLDLHQDLAWLSASSSSSSLAQTCAVLSRSVALESALVIAASVHKRDQLTSVSSTAFLVTCQKRYLSVLAFALETLPLVRKPPRSRVGRPSSWTRS